jgi:2-polyprenyl-3-methyl-5-hydroxy-6-metoxy-1,4-benzoquinol methylase
MLKRVDALSKELKRPLRVVDLACGGGLISCAIARMGHRVLGLDLDPSEIHWAKLFALETQVNAIFWQADLLAPSQPPSPLDPHGRPWELTAEDALGGKPDLVVLAYALHHLPEPELLVRRLANWLEPSARLLVNEENPKSLTFLLKHRLREWIQHDTEAEHHRSLSAWKELLEAHGFRIDFLAGRDVLPGLAYLSPARCWSLVFVAHR